jgi:hypothetical protein
MPLAARHRKSVSNKKGDRFIEIGGNLSRKCFLSYVQSSNIRESLDFYYPQNIYKITERKTLITAESSKSLALAKAKSASLEENELCQNT